MTCVNEEGKDIYENFKNTISRSFYIYDELKLKYEEAEYEHYSSSGCSNVSTGLIITIVIVVIIVIILVVVLVMRSKKNKSII